MVQTRWLYVGRQDIYNVLSFALTLLPWPPKLRNTCGNSRIVPVDDMLPERGDLTW